MKSPRGVCVWWGGGGRRTSSERLQKRILELGRIMVSASLVLVKWWPKYESRQNKSNQKHKKISVVQFNLIQESPHAWMQQAYRPPRSKYTVQAGGGTPFPGLDGGYPLPRSGRGGGTPFWWWGGGVIPWDGDTPIQTWEGVPPSGPGKGYPPPGPAKGVTPLSARWGYPPPRNVDRQTPVKTIPSLILRKRAVNIEQVSAADPRILDPPLGMKWISSN